MAYSSGCDCPLGFPHWQGGFSGPQGKSHDRVPAGGSPRTALYHFRTAAGSEVDVVLEKPDGSVAGVEVKASATVGGSDFAALQELRDQLGKKFIAGIVLYSGDQMIPFGDKLWLVPLPLLWAK
jgi:predicted AAA+ superfamily ATPase